jgi:uncharacterized membrane protein (DUF4010 family)
MTAVNEINQLIQLATALGIGLLIGIERGWKARDAGPGERIAGVRTFSLFGLLGGGVGIAATELGGIVLGLGVVALTGVLVTSYVLSYQTHKDLGITSLMAALVAFVLGALAGLGYVEIAAAAAVAATLLLGFKPELHRWVESLSEQELRAGLKLLVISVVLLPVLPNRGYGPWQAINPYQLWWMVVLIAAISFVGYFAVKLIGASRGILFTGFFGGLASSTGLTLHFSRTARSKPGLDDVLAAGVLLACGTAFPRLAVIAAVINPSLVKLALIPLVVMTAIVYLSAIVFWRRQPNTKADSEAILDNPLELKSALSFGLLLALILLLARGLKQWFGDYGVLALSAVSGIADVDAITLSLARMSTEDLTMVTAALGLIIAAAVNTLVKGIMTASIGGAQFGWRAGIPLGVAAIAGLGTALWIG